MREWNTEAVESLAKASQFNCPNCGADIQYDPKSGSLLCQYCEESVVLTQNQGTTQIVEYDLDHGRTIARDRKQNSDMPIAQELRRGAKRQRSILEL